MFTFLPKRYQKAVLITLMILRIIGFFIVMLVNSANAKSSHIWIVVIPLIRKSINHHHSHERVPELHLFVQGIALIFLIRAASSPRLK